MSSPAFRKWLKKISLRQIDPLVRSVEQILKCVMLLHFGLLIGRAFDPRKNGRENGW